MLEPREADIPALFLVLVVLPLVAYILLGKWSEDAKKRERVSLLAQQAAEEAFRAESRISASAIPLVSSSNNVHHVCARCFSPATTRCSKCKSVRYCSGKCQIVHWRQVHKNECHQLGNYNTPTTFSRSNLVEQSIYDSALLDGNVSSQYLRGNGNPIVIGNTPLDTIIYPFMTPVTSAPTAGFDIDASQISMPNRRTKEQSGLHKFNRENLRRDDGTVFYSSEGTSGIAELAHGHVTPRSTMDDTFEYHSLHGNTIVPKGSYGRSFSVTDAHGIGTEPFLNDGKGRMIFDDEAVELNCPSKATTVKDSLKGKKALPLPGSKISRPPKSRMVGSRENLCFEIESRGNAVDETKTTSMGIMKMIGLRKPAVPARHDAPGVNSDRHKKIKMLFPYEQFLELFEYEIFELIPRGLMNCGNSCYANAVLQCLTCTKPLIIYLLQRSHSRSCCAKDWCLMCELEQHAMMLREGGGGPFSLSGILSRMRSTNIQIGDGSQEDAHEFLRLLVGSMQSICLDGLGGETKVDNRLQETTFIQHTFGGRLRSKVKCLRCHHESERYENIMDLTLEIYGWVESLEDALTQFTTPEDLDGENMYRCGRCAGYVPARKQLSIHEAPNVLTIVLKRFQEGRYGKINKWITFPEMLDMIPFMTGTNDMPPLYMLYGVVVHLDTLNASFSGHYISYVKDLQGNWFRIDDTEVQLVPTSQVMSEGAYILFYTRSSPRPQRAPASKASASKVSSKRSSSNEPLREKRTEFTMDCSNHAPYGFHMEFSDATSSDWSLFTSSDEASFTTESTRDSFSMDDPFSSIFGAPHNEVSCRMSSNGRAHTRFVSEEKGRVSGIYLPNQVSDFSKELGSVFVRDGSEVKVGADRTFSYCCKL